jgi:hypothetical protein
MWVGVFGNRSRRTTPLLVKDWIQAANFSGDLGYWIIFLVSVIEESVQDDSRPDISAASTGLTSLMPKDFKPFSTALDLRFVVEEEVSNRSSRHLSAATDEVFITGH